MNIQSLMHRLSVLAIVGVLAACGNNDDAATKVTEQAIPKKKITVAFGPSTYSEQFIQSIQPILEKKGYEVVPRIFSHNTQVNRSMKDGEIDASVFQSRAYMEDINQLLGMEMVKLADTASAPQSIWSSRHKTLDEIADGMIITVPNDPVNAERAARILEGLGWIKVKDGIDPVKFSVRDIEKGQYELTLKEIDPAQALRALDDADYAIVNGNYIANMGMNISDSLLIEETPEPHVVIVTILTKDRETEWAKDLKAAYESDEFREYILSVPLYKGFIMPKVWAE